MRIHVRHEIVQTFEPAAKVLNQTLRLTPRGHEGQHVIHWRLDIDADCRLRQGEDAFGSHVHAFTIDGPQQTLRVIAEGEVETFDTAGVVHNTFERFPPELFLRDTALTTPDAALRAYAHDTAKGDSIARLHALLVGVGEAMTRDEDLPPLPAAEALARGAGGAVDMAHVFVACARAIGAPARFVRGHNLDIEAGGRAVACHAWAEAHVNGVGWIAFDPALGICPHEHHVRIACGLDGQDAAALRSASANRAASTFVAKIDLNPPPARQSQRQWG